ncbi:MAG: dihydroorotase [Lachnospiraceae bacterium]|nr:dihydroorotase [Lachnospiraceae bacterium]
MIIKNGNLIDPASGIFSKKDILIENGIISKVSDNINPNEYSEADLIDASDLTVCPGFTDVHVHFRDPGFPDKETMHTGALAAAAGGYTSVVCMANTSPAIDNVDLYKEISEKASAEDIHIYQAASITKTRSGNECVDMKALKDAGVVLFTDDGSPIMKEDVIKEAMKKAASLNTILSFHEEDPAYIGTSGVNAGPAAEALGLKGADREAEIAMVRRDIEIAFETGAMIDIQHISAAESISLLREAKKNDPHKLLHAEATPNHFSLTEEAVAKYGTLAKINPPLRTEADRLAIIEGLKDGTIDMIATDHAPHTSEEKARPFHKAPSGIIGLETAFSLALKNLVLTGHLSMPELIRLMSLNPAKLLGLNAGKLSEGSPADIAIVSVSKDSCYNSFKSRSSNSPFLGETLPGSVEMTICSGKTVFKK